MRNCNRFVIDEAGLVCDNKSMEYAPEMACRGGEKMKTTVTRMLALLLAVTMLLGGVVVPVFADEVEETISEETRPEETQPEETVPEQAPMDALPPAMAGNHRLEYPALLDRYVFPDTWARPALEFCVGNAIMEGRENGLAPDGCITRAETAALLVRLLGAGEKPNALSGYTDVEPQAWYYGELSAAVGAGLVRGTSASTLCPNDCLTREDACVLLSRAFGILPVNAQSYQRFADAASVSTYARVAVSGLAERGFLTGYGDNTIRPKGRITRAEFAKLIYEAVTHIVDTPRRLPSYSRVLYRGNEPIPEGYRISGDLILGYGYCGGTLSGVEITGQLSVCLEPGKGLELQDCQLNKVSVASCDKLTGNSRPAYLLLGERAWAIDLSADHVRASYSSTLEGSYKDIIVLQGGMCLTLNGKADSVSLNGNYDTAQGSGYTQAVEVYGNNCKVTLSCGKLTDHVYLGLYNSALSTVQTVYSWYNYQRREPYATATMEGFVNQMGYTSDTEYLIWVSTTTTTVNVFKGSKGAWKLEKSMDCALGAPYSPTVKGTFKTFLRDNEWDFGSYKCRWVTYFYKGYAFHSRKWSPDYSYLVDPSINCLVSAGCVRMYDEGCYYIYSTIPVGTTVVVY